MAVQVDSRDAYTRFFDRFILKKVKQSSRVRVCDLCCGDGRDLSLLQGRVGSLFGVDISRKAIYDCTNRFKGDRSIHCIQADALKTGLPSAYFDYALVRVGLHHIKDKAAFAREAQRILRPGGELVVVDRYYVGKLPFFIYSLYKLLTVGNSHFSESNVSGEEFRRIFSGFELVEWREIAMANFRGFTAVFRKSR
jgi:ubiquinone/menaquinone biosynthesis C-methylase UbiE